MMNKLIFLGLVIPVLMLQVPNVLAGNNDECKFGKGNCEPGSCYTRGVEDGKNNDFGDYFKIDPSKDCDAEEFFPRYYQGFIDGCISVGNTKETCERFTD